MTKQDLQQELLEKVREGVKPSDLKRPRRIIKPDDGYESSGSDKTTPQAPPLPNQDLKNQINSLQKQLQLYKDFRETDVKIKEKLKQENESLKKTIQDLQNKQKNPVKTKETGTQTETFTLKNYSCKICFTTRKGGIPSQFLRVKGLGGERNKKIWVCFICRKQVVVIYDEEENWRDF